MYVFYLPRYKNKHIVFTHRGQLHPRGSNFASRAEIKNWPRRPHKCVSTSTDSFKSQWHHVNQSSRHLNLDTFVQAWFAIEKNRKIWSMSVLSIRKSSMTSKKWKKLFFDLRQIIDNILLDWRPTSETSFMVNLLFIIFGDFCQFWREKIIVLLYIKPKLGTIFFRLSSFLRHNRHFLAKIFFLIITLTPIWGLVIFPPIDISRQATMYNKLRKSIGAIQSRVARFFLVQNTKTGENIPNYHKIYQIATQYFQ
jgi:hypothetical protein